MKQSQIFENLAAITDTIETIDYVLLRKRDEDYLKNTVQDLIGLVLTIDPCYDADIIQLKKDYLIKVKELCVLSKRNLLLLCQNETTVK